MKAQDLIDFLKRIIDETPKLANTEVIIEVDCHPALAEDVYFGLDDRFHINNHIGDR